MNKSGDVLELLCNRKRVNHLFHAFVSLTHKDVPKASHEHDKPKERLSLILPMTSASFRFVPPPMTAYARPEISQFAAIGKIVGVVYSIHRIQKEVTLHRLYIRRQVRFN